VARIIAEKTEGYEATITGFEPPSIIGSPPFVLERSALHEKQPEPELVASNQASSK
jgi:hypothetical protein